MYREPLETYRRYAKEHLSPGRYRHSQAVGEVLERAADIYGYDPALGVAAGLLHDIAKEHDEDTMLRILREHDPESLEHLGSYTHQVYLHGPAGAWVAKAKLSIADEKLLTAIRTHSGEYPEMDLFSRCVHVADMTAPCTFYRGVGKLAKIFLEGRLDEAELLLDHWLVDCSAEVGFPVHPGYLQRIQELTEILHPDESFFARTDP